MYTLFPIHFPNINRKTSFKKANKCQSKSINCKKLIVHLKLVPISMLIGKNVDADLELVFF